MADTYNLSIVIDAQDKASQVLESMGGKLRDLASAATAGSAVIAGALGFVAKDAIETGMNFESARVSFETFLKSGEKAGKLLQDLSDFAVKTPFDLPQVVDGTKRLLAYGVAANDVIPTFKTLGDISSGNKQKLDQLVLAYGQVKAATKLTGAELRQFTEAGVPLLQALADELNKTGGGMVKVSSGASKAKVDVAKVTEQMGILNQKMSENKEKYKEGSVAYRQAQLTLKGYQDQLAKATTSTTTFSKATKLTAGDIKEMISNNEISFEMVQKALSSLNSEGGMFFQNMEKQSKTLGGILSNTRDEFIRFMIGVLGFTQQGDIRQGSLFYYLEMGASMFLQALQQVRPVAQQFVDDMLKNIPAVIAIIGALVGLITPLVIAFIGLIAPALLFVAAGAAIGAVIGYVIANFQQLKPLLEVIGAILVALAIVAIPPLIAGFVSWAVAAVTAAAATVVAMLPIIIVVGLIAAAVYLLYQAWINNWGGIHEKTKAFTDWFQKTGLPNLLAGFDNIQNFVKTLADNWVDNFNKIKKVVEDVISAIGRVKGAISNDKGQFKLPGFQHGGFVPGSYGDAVPAILHGGERIVPRNGVDVNNSGSSTPSVSINISGTFNLDSDDRVDELAQRIIRILGRQNELASKGVGF